jgi:uncharacterized coiled-coil DUF342 family protein
MSVPPTPPQFLIDFQDKMAKLNNVKKNIQSSIDFKEKFTNDLKGQLGNINTKLQELVGLINTLKSKANTLQGEINTNSSSITDKENQMKALEAQVKQLTTERDDLANQIDAQKTSLQKQIDQLQKQIDNCEAQLRDITQKYNTQTAQVTALENQLKDSGSQNATAAQQIQTLTEENQKQLQEQSATYETKITDYENQIKTIQQQLADKENELQQLHNNSNTGKTQLQEQIKSLEQEVQNLKDNNSKMENEFNTATKAIDEAADDLKSLMDTVPNPQTKKEVDTLIQGLEQQIQSLIDDLNNGSTVAPSISGQNLNNTRLPGMYASTVNATGSNPLLNKKAKPKPANLPPDTMLAFTMFGTTNKTQMKFSDIMNQLNIKAKAIPGEDKYEILFNQLKGATTEAQAQQMIENSRITIKNGQLFGGKKTKKNRKQKGGFVYRHSSSRKRISVTSKRVKQNKTTLR